MARRVAVMKSEVATAEAAQKEGEAEEREEVEEEGA